MHQAKLIDLSRIVEPAVTLELAIDHGLTRDEYDQILKYLGREPTFTELGIYSVMWSEHCSYKNSISILKKLPKTGARVLKGAGEENAGLIDIGNGLAVAFKIESHNHPSAIEPYQGAATGVGGILRDVIAMGARPIACLNSLRFGALDDANVRYLLSGVVKGIGDYGNCFGVPTVGGEIYFEEPYTKNPLVNAMAVGLVEHGKTATAIASGVGNSVIIAGSATGRDGIHGATFASEEISEKSESKRPNVQIGDPFTEKLLLEATLESIEKGHVVGVQDMGAAGIVCSSSEMSAKGGCGVEIELSKVPLREDFMTPYEMCLSESQERMLLVVEKGHEAEIISVFEKWDLPAFVIGQVIEQPNLVIKFKDRIFADIPSESLVLGGGAPVYQRESVKPEYLDRIHELDVNKLREPASYELALLSLLSSANIANKSWVYDQYDSMVQTNTILPPGGGAAVIRIKDTDLALSVKVDCNGRYVYLNPRRGGQFAVAESARNVVCSGARPMAITNCLNFGNPYKPEMYWQFEEAVMGMGEACEVFETPVTGGNVSFYNESPDGPIYPTPIIGMVGMIESLAHITAPWFKNEGDIICLIGRNTGEIGGSEYLKTLHGMVCGDIPELDLDYEKRVQDFVYETICSGMIESAQDVSDGGLAVALAEACMGSDSRPGIGAQVHLEEKIRADRLLFSESPSRIVLSIAPANLAELKSLARQKGIDFAAIGKVGGETLKINEWIDCKIPVLEEAYFQSLSKAMAT